MRHGISQTFPLVARRVSTSATFQSDPYGQRGVPPQDWRCDSARPSILSAEGTTSQSGRQDSNLRHPASKAGTLGQTELLPVRRDRRESHLATSG